MVDNKSLLNLSGAKPAPRDVSSQGQTINEEAGLPENWVAIDRPPIIPASSPQAGDTGASRYLQGSLPPGYQHDTSFVGTSYRGSNTPILTLMPLGLQGNPATNAAIQSTSRLTTVAAPVVPVVPPVAVSDGLTHGRLPWPGDAGVVQFTDDFHCQNTGTFVSGIPIGSIGELGWSIVGSTSTIGGNYGGIPPYLGQFGWGNVGVQNEAAWLLFNCSSGSALYQTFGWALAENPACVISYVFKVDGNLSSGTLFDMTQKSMYVGLTGPGSIPADATVPSSRPDVFIGVRYDTTPAIGDTFLVLEVVANITPHSPARNNTQGVALVTNVAPLAGVWHRLDIYFNTAGSVTVTLDGSTTNTLTTPIPIITFTQAVAASSVNNGIVEVNWGTAAGDPLNPWAAGSSVTMSGFTGTLNLLNGIHQVNGGDDAIVWISATGTYSDNDAAVTFSGYPSFLPVFLFGDDDTALPTANSAEFFVDYWSFVWNPNLGPNAPGVPDPTKPRYF